MAPKQQLNPLVKMGLDLGPLLLFFFANEHYGIFTATAAFMVATVLALAASYFMVGRVSAVPLATAVIVVVFGGLTLILHNETFIKVKPTIIYALFGVVLLGGLAFGKSLLSVEFGEVFQLTEEGWRKLTLRWGLFFFALAVLNEVVWRHTSTNTWVTFKVFGVIPLIFLFTLAQVPFLKKYSSEPAE